MASGVNFGRAARKAEVEPRGGMITCSVTRGSAGWGSVEGSWLEGSDRKMPTNDRRGRRLTEAAGCARVSRSAPAARQKKLWRSRSLFGGELGVAS